MYLRNLSSLKIPRYADLNCTSLGMDSAMHCFDKKHFASFGPVTYQFNEIGFRTKSTAQMRGDEILAIGDSFTLGLGVNSQDRWTDQLECMIGYPVLNFSLNGASNDWIARKTNELLRYFDPRCIIIHWTFSHRRELANTDWTDDERTECEPFYTQEQNLSNWLANCESINFDPIVHSAIPDWHSDFDYEKHTVLAPIAPVDCARDGFHYGPKTHRLLAEKFTNLLACG